MVGNENQGLPLIAPRLVPALDPGFRPAVLARRSFESQAAALGAAVPVRLALEQNNGVVSHIATQVFRPDHPLSAGNFTHVERIAKLMLWSRGGFRFHLEGPPALAEALRRHYRETATGQFDANVVAGRMFDHPLEVIATREVPADRPSTAALGRHLDGCRIGFDLGGSDRKAAAVIDGKVVFSEETPWDPYFQADPAYHFQGIMESLRKAAAHLPRVDAIGGSAAGIYLDNRVKVASLFRGVPAEVFNARVRNLMLDVKAAWNSVPFEVINDGEVTALAGSMAHNLRRILGISLGTSTAGGYVNAEGNLTSWINELAFAPVDYNPSAPTDEWSGDYGCAVQYLSQQAVGRLLKPAGIPAEPGASLPEKLRQVQHLMTAGDPRARRIYETLGIYLGYAVAQFADFYDLDNVLILGRVTSGEGGDVILHGARQVLAAEFPALAAKIAFHIPDEKDKRHGQAIAAASLPTIPARS